ncbi:RNA polymerase sigma factor [Radicibacter daui]|uniref:RNA polymerase sigma factor n=1 Tax=Radicibacter daui TaxID=3064829 RepID=UPI004046C3EB
MDEMAALIEPHIPSLRRYAYALLRGDEAADDLVQDCLERAVRGWRLRPRDGQVRLWLFTILRNRYIDGFRARRMRGLQVDAAVLEQVPASGVDGEARLAALDVLAGIEQLPEEQRSALLLVAVEELSYADTARVLDVPVGTVMSRLARARERLKQLLERGAGPALRRVK